MRALARLEAAPEEQIAKGRAVELRGRIRAGLVHTLQTQLPKLTRGEGVLESMFDSYQAVRGVPPTRARTDNNPLDRQQYLLKVRGTM